MFNQLDKFRELMSKSAPCKAVKNPLLDNNAPDEFVSQKIIGENESINAELSAKIDGAAK